MPAVTWRSRELGWFVGGDVASFAIGGRFVGVMWPAAFACEVVVVLVVLVVERPPFVFVVAGLGFGRSRRRRARPRPGLAQ